MSATTSPTASTEVLAKLFFYNLYDRLAAVAAAAANGHQSPGTPLDPATLDAAAAAATNPVADTSRAAIAAAAAAAAAATATSVVAANPEEPPTPPRTPHQSGAPNADAASVSAMIENFHQSLNQRIEQMAAAAAAAAAAANNAPLPLISVTPASKLMARHSGRTPMVDSDTEPTNGGHDDEDLEEDDDDDQQQQSRRLATTVTDEDDEDEDDESGSSRAFDLSYRFNGAGAGFADDSSNLSANSSHGDHQPHQLQTPLALRWIGGDQASTSAAAAASLVSCIHGRPIVRN